MATVAVAGIAWALLVPPFQAPDETTHFAYAQSLATRFALPGDPRRPLGISTDQTLADAAVRASSLAFFSRAVRPQWNERDFKAYLAQTRLHPSQSDGGGPNPAAANPPLFYLYSDLAYWASGSDNLFGRLYAMRLWGVVLLLANVVAGWLLAGEVLGRRRLAQLVCAAVCGLIPTETFLATSVNPDALMVPLWTLALWLGARLIGRGWSNWNAIALCAITAAAILTKATSYALLPAVLAALVLVSHREPQQRRRALLRNAATAVATLALPVLVWVALATSQGRSPVNTVQAPIGNGPGSGFHVGGFFSYVWQFYLPRLPFLSKFHIAPDLPIYGVWLKQGWATFGWTDVHLPSWAYGVLSAITALIAIAGAALVPAMKRARRLPWIAFFGLALLSLLFGLHLTEYRALIGGQGSLLQGRYLLPMIGLFGATVGLIVLRTPIRWRGVTAGALLAGLLVLQVLSLATVAKAYYT
jgi:4-amino-4-deoxy-L-arabinose transferase-like glycosyltransferase